MNKLFIAGATGYTGQALVRTAREAGHTVVAHVRPGSTSGDRLVPVFESLGAIVDRTPWEPTPLAATLAVHAPDTIFSLLGTTRARSKAAAARGETATYESVDRDLTLMLHAAASGSSPAPRFVFLSSIGAERPGRNRYLRARGEVEAALAAGSLPWTSARPSFITGPDRDEVRHGERIGAMLFDGGLRMLSAVGIQGPQARYGPMDATTLARALLRIAADPSTADQVVEAAALRPA
ncbi:MAG: NAD(P)H-binding protein [Myxococcota bacterium]|nr:NAD(P)H-binding protein [Myxococcota bacterium]